MDITGAVILKPERDKSLRNFHPWVFMGAVEKFPEFENGDILPVINSDKQFLGYGYFNQGKSIVGRMISFHDGDPKQIIIDNIKSAIALRKTVVPENTTAYRLINGEADNLPGLIVDVYADVLVLQANTLGIEKLKPLILETLSNTIKPKAIYEKSTSPTRRGEGLEDVEGWITSEVPQPVEILEHGLKFSVSFADSQKTGMFLDQREMRQLVKNYSKDRTVLNCFSYSGGFSIYALAGQALQADSVDSDKNAISSAKDNLLLNGFDANKNGLYASDVMAFLSQSKLPANYDFIILDPPAFAKRSSDVKNASRGYRDLNRLAMQKLPKGGLLLTSSCSSHIDKDLFKTIIFQAAKDAKRNIKILSYHVLAADHPVNLFFPEGDYLKSLLLYLE